MLHLALVGCGGMAHAHAATLQKFPDVKVVALCDTVPSRSAAFKQKYFADAAEFDDFDTMLAKPPAKLDAVLLVTPHAVHYPQAKAALQHGMHVLVEKPMVTNSEHAYDLWRTQKASGKLLGIAYQAPFTAEYQYLKQMRDRGEWGKVQLAQGWLAQGWLKATAGSWRQDPAQSGGGQMYDSGSHVLNGMMWLMNDPVVEVSCFIDNVGSPVDINGVAILKFQNGAMGSIAIGGNSPGWHVRLQFQTDKLQFVTGPHGGYVEIAGSPAHKYPHVPTSDHPAAFTPHLNFVNAILGREELQTGPRFGALLSALMDAMYESARTGTTVTVRPVPQDI